MIRSVTLAKPATKDHATVGTLDRVANSRSLPFADLYLLRGLEGFRINLKKGVNTAKQLGFDLSRCPVDDMHSHRPH
jgi:hypothetical protein